MSRSFVVVFWSMALLVCLVPAAQAQQPTAAPARPADTPDEVRKVSDELSRLRQEFDQLRRLYDERLLALEQRLGQITGGPMAAAGSTGPTATTALPPQAPIAGEPASASATPVQDPVAPAPDLPAAPQAATGSSKVFNPDTSVIGNFAGAAGRNPFG